MISFLVKISRIHRRYLIRNQMMSRLDFFEVHEMLIEFWLFLGMAEECLDIYSHIVIII